MTIRSDLKAAVTPLLLPRRQWKIVDTERSLDVLEKGKFVVMFRQRTIEPGPSQGSLTTGLVMTVISPRAIADDYEDDLDEACGRLLDVLRTKLPNLLWSGATKRVWNDTNPAYDFDVTVVAEIP